MPTLRPLLSAFFPLGGRAGTLIAACALFVFGVTLGHDFVLWDDGLLITGNPDIRGLSVHNIVRAFSTYDPELYVPLTYLSYQLDYSLAKLAPGMYHATNLLLHTLNAVLVGSLLYVLTGKRSGAVLGAVLFAVHPLQAETVAWASARKDLLCAFFFLLSMLSFFAYREQDSKRWYYASLTLFALSLLAKVTSVTLPVVLLLVDWLEQRPLDRKAVLEKIPFVLLSIVFGVIALFGKREAADLVTPAMLLLVAGKSVTFYVQKLLLPTGLSVLYPLEGAVQALRPDILLPCLATVALTAAAVMVRRMRIVAFAWAWYLLTLAPTFSNIAKGGEIYFASDRYAYIPLIGLLAAVAWGWSKAEDAFARNVPRLRAAAAAVVGVFAVLALVQGMTWKDSFSLFRQTLRSYPHSLAARINLSVAYRQAKQYDASRRELEEALKIRDHQKIHISLSAIALEEQRYDEALRELDKAFALKPSDPEVQYGYGIAHMRAGRRPQAIEAYRRTLALQPEHLGARNNLASVLLEQGDLEGAAAEFRTIVAQDRTFSVGHYNLGLIEEQLGNIEEAVASYERARETSSTQQFDILSHLGPAYAKVGRDTEAVAVLRQALRMNATDAAFLSEALLALQTILERSPRQQEAQALLGEMMDRGLIRSR